VEFEWDSKKAERNLKVHGVNFEEAATLFYDPKGLDLPDEKHSASEVRYIRLGKSIFKRTLMAVYTQRGKARKLVRLISARRANRKERKIYEDQNIG